MKESPKSGLAPWSAAPSAKTKNAVQRAVTALLDELAPERVLRRAERLQGRIEQHRTPTGCVLQAADGAVSVSWFSDSTKDSVLGELHVLVWHGKVSRRGSPRNVKNATVAAQLVLHPIETPSDDSIWRATDGARYSTASLAVKCLTLLEAQIAGTG